MKTSTTAFFIFFFQVWSAGGWADPSSLFWTNCTTAIEPTGDVHLDQNNYISLTNERVRSPSVPPDFGVLWGVYTWKDWSLEAGIDYLGSTINGVILNAKIGVQENVLFSRAPAFNVGIYSVGVSRPRQTQTNQNIVDIIFGKSLPESIGGLFYLGFFSGSKAIGKNRQGFMIGFERDFYPVKDKNGNEYFKWNFAADYASGKNTQGGGGFALTYYFTPNFSVETGPVWFNDVHINGKWKWAIQLSVDFPGSQAEG